MIVAGIIIVCYCFLMMVFLIGFDRITEFKFTNTTSNISFSVIIPFRNEAECLPELLASIQRLEYPAAHVEFLFVDDESTDNSVHLIRQYSQKMEAQGATSNIRLLKNIHNSGSPKKDAIQTAIQQASHEWVLTTDADCQLPKNWLKCFDAYIQKNDVIMVAGPVRYLKRSSFLSNFQHAEFHTLQSVTIGSFGIGNAMMCNGANLAYTKSAFQSVHGFEGNQSIASGDDVFLFEKMYQKDKKKVHFLKSREALVSTLPQKSWKQLIEQRVRWASKSVHYNSVFTKEVGILVFITNLTLVISTFLTFFSIFSWLFLITVYVLKISFDTLLYAKFHRFFIDHKTFKMHFLSGLSYPFMSVLVALLSLFSGYTWKGRQFSK